MKAVTVLCAAVCFAAGHASAATSVRDEGNSFLLENGRISARIDKAKGTLFSMKRGGVELLAGGTGYWSLSAGSEGERVHSFPRPAAARIVREGAVGEVALDGASKGEPGILPVEVSFRYALPEDSDSLHIYAVFRHGPGMAGFSIGEGRYVVKPDPRVFDHFTVDPARSREMPTGGDWDRGAPLNLKEARRLTSGKHAGTAEHKYGYSALFSDSPAYGWSSSKEKLGLWMLHPSLEFVAGGPAKVELTGHLDVNPGGRPVLLSMWHGSHYGGTSLAVARDEPWSKVVGPFLLHVNEGGDALSLWRAAMKTTGEEAKRWPYAWIDEPLHAANERVAVQGKLGVTDPAGPVKRGTMWVGLTAPDYPARGGRRSETVGWQRDGKFYQYWAKAAADGSFRLPTVRPGRYTLHAYGDGIPGEFARPDVTVEPGKPSDLGTLEWTVARSGPVVWEIGIPDRSAREFRDGDRYWRWGQHFRYRENFPDGVDYTVGKSDWRKDWNLCQPLRVDDHGRVLGPSVWKIRFDLPEPGDHRLKIALCGHRQDCRLGISLNGRPVGDSGRFPENGVMHRDGHRGLLTELDFLLPADALKPAGNVLELTLDGRSWHQAILYDHLRLERVDPRIAGEEAPSPAS